LGGTVTIRRLAFETGILTLIGDLGAEEIAPEVRRDMEGLDRHERLRVLVAHLAMHCDEDLMGVCVARRTPLAAFGALAHAIISAPTIRSALHLSIRHISLFQPDRRNAARLSSGKSHVFLDYLAPAILPESEVFMTDLFLASNVQTLRYLTGPNLAGVCLELDRDVSNRDAYEAEIGVPVRFGAGRNRLVIPKVLAMKPLGSAFIPQSAAHLRLSENSLSEAARQDSFVNRVLQALQNPQLPGRNARVIADMLGVSQRTLRRRLEAAGTSFGQILRQSNHELAVLYLREFSIGDVARLLGYYDASTFRRAFKEWAGMTPSEYISSV
jgi:AraC-like DNA-binding protein